MAAEMEAAWKKAGTPGENHALLNYMIGKWDCTVKTMQPPMTSTGISKNEWVFDKRYVLHKFKSEWMGEPFEGEGITGYDNLKKEFFSTWMDSMSTGLFLQQGDYDPATKTFTYIGECVYPIQGKLNTKTTIQVISNDKHILIMYKGKDANNLPKDMQITYQRAGSMANTLEAGCGKCSYGMDGIKSCILAVKIDGEAYLVEGAEVNAHSAGLCRSTKKAVCTGEIKNGKFVSTSFKIEE
ncbi:MAG: DUF6370 family protein, partial [Planctomycetota bacterium]